MSRGVLAVDRVVAFLLGLVLLLAGLAAIAWGAGRLYLVWPAVPAVLRLRALRAAVELGWWAPTVAVAGVVAVALGLWWLLAHLPRRGVGTLALPGAGGGGLRLDPDAAVAAAADALAQAPGVRSASGSMRDDRGELVALLDATIEPTADLGAVVAAAEQVSAELGHVLSLPAARCRVELSVARRGRQLARAG
ncbi:hypothetical protein [Georgenia ruanii]|uniref:hypothetical protein n=1 Tax=Georgenia ruanii TaxID=348442 RepID=UPI0012651D85|nr:hypothetical protein [Georgenia ruanii]